MKTIERTIAAAVIFSADGKIFQGQKDSAKKGVYAGSWMLPGGGVEAGETIEQALVREVREETGLDISSHAFELVEEGATGESEKTLDTGEKILVKMKFFTYKIQLSTNAQDTPIELGDEFFRYQWTDPTNLKHIPLSPPSVELFAKMGYL